MEFSKGEFIRYINKPASFGIFEGVDLDPTMKYTKKWSLVIFFDPSKYCQDADGKWDTRPVIELGKDGKPCPKSVDTMKEDYSWKICTPIEKKAAIEKLAEFGLEWDEEEMTLTDVQTGEILHKVIVPKIEYNGELIKPIRGEFKEMIKNYVINENKPTYSSTYPTTYGAGGYGQRHMHSPYYNEYGEYEDY